MGADSRKKIKVGIESRFITQYENNLENHYDNASGFPGSVRLVLEGDTDIEQSTHEKYKVELREGEDNVSVHLADRYTVTSNRESGFGRYDVLLKPLNREDNGIILEFKVYNSRKEKTLQETARAALQQIEEKQYETVLLEEGSSKGKIKKYGFAFEGKKVLIESSEDLQEMEGLKPLQAF